MAAPVRTNEAPGTRAVGRFLRVSAFKVRPVLDLVRGLDIEAAREALALTDRDAATKVAKVLESAVANAEHNDEQMAEELYVSACFADEGPTLRRFRPRARGRATRIRKRTCHITVIVSRMSSEEIERRRQIEAGKAGTRAARRAAQEEAEARRVAEDQAAAPETDEEVSAAETEAESEVATAEPEAESPEETTAEPEAESEETTAETETESEVATAEPEAESPEEATAEPEAESPEEATAEPEAAAEDAEEPAEEIVEAAAAPDQPADENDDEKG